jgi:hypothetical protein
MISCYLKVNSAYRILSPRIRFLAFELTKFIATSKELFFAVQID